MPHPINPPAMGYLLRMQLRSPVYHGWGLIQSFHSWWFWEPLRMELLPSDWVVGPYPRRAQATSALFAYSLRLGDGPLLRHGWVC